MKVIFIAIMSVALISAAAAQQMIPLTDWRASLENDLSRLSMPRDSHAAVFNILQAYERQAQGAKIRSDLSGAPNIGPYGVPHIAPPEEPPKN